MIKIAFIAARLEAGGAERQINELIKGMDRAQFKAIVVCLYNLGVIGEEIKGLGIKSYSGLLKSRFSFHAIRTLSEILKKEQVDIVFLWNQPLTMIYGIAAAKIAGIDKILAVIHNTGYIERKFRTDIINRLFMRFINKIVATGTDHKRYVIQKEHVPAEKAVIIFNGVEIKDYGMKIDKQRKKEELGIPLDAKIVGIIARLHKAKRHDIFLKAAQLIRAEYKKVFFIIVGDGEERDKVKDLIHELGLDQNVKMFGLRRDIAEINRVLDIAVLSSDPLVETMPMSVIESMASSVPVVSTHVGSLSDMVLDGENGFLVRPGSATELASAVLKILNDEKLAAKMGLRGYDIACESFSQGAMVKRYEALFRAEVSHQ